MKKLIIILSMLTASSVAMAQHGWRHHGHPGYYYGGGNWVAPLIIGGVVGAAIANRPVQAQTETVIVQKQPIIVQQQENCTPWKEIQTPDGKTYRERTCTQ